MTCSMPGRYEEAIVDLARGVTLLPGTAAAARSHLELCEACAARFAREQALSRGLRALAAKAAAESAPASVERRLLDAFAAHHGAANRRRSVSVKWLAAAAALILVAGLGAWSAWQVKKPARPVAVQNTTAGSDAPARPLDDFVFLPAAIGLPAMESGRIVRVEIPVTALPAYGVPMIPDPVRTAVQADFLVGQDGQARAIRLVKVNPLATGKP